jgi:carbon-monoxide dehydrogenase medium subunit
MKPARFEYVAAHSVDQALELLGRHGDGAKLLAGGQSLVPLMNMRLARPSHVIDLNRLPGLAYITEADGGVRIGAMTRQATAESSEMIRARYPIVTEALELLGHPAIRNRGTVGGSLAHADPAAELPVVVLALDAQLTLTGPRGRRTVPACDFFVGYLHTVAAPDEILTEVCLPAPPARTGSCFLEVARRHGDFALVAVAAVLALHSDGRCARARLVFGGVGPTPMRVERAEAVLVGHRPEPELFAAAAREVSAVLQPESDLHASADYRAQVASVLTRRALGMAFERVSGRERA